VHREVSTSEIKLDRRRLKARLIVSKNMIHGFLWLKNELFLDSKVL
jgi:hypothetical protein